VWEPEKAKNRRFGGALPKGTATLEIINNWGKEEGKTSVGEKHELKDCGREKTERRGGAAYSRYARSKNQQHRGRVEGGDKSAGGINQILFDRQREKKKLATTTGGSYI